MLLFLRTICEARSILPASSYRIGWLRENRTIIVLFIPRDLFLLNRVAVDQTRHNKDLSKKLKSLNAKTKPKHIQGNLQVGLRERRVQTLGCFRWEFDLLDPRSSRYRQNGVDCPALWIIREFSPQMVTCLNCIVGRLTYLDCII